MGIEVALAQLLTKRFSEQVSVALWLKDPDRRVLVYFTWCEVLLRSVGGVGNGRKDKQVGDSALIQAFEWFRTTYAAHPLRANNELARLRIFSCLQCIVDVASDQCQDQTVCEGGHACLDLQRTSDLVRLLTVDLYTMFDNEVFITSNDSFSDFVRPEEADFSPPSTIIKRIETRMEAQASRTEAYIQMTTSVESMVASETTEEKLSKVHWLLKYIFFCLYRFFPPPAVSQSIKLRLLAMEKDERYQNDYDYLVGAILYQVVEGINGMLMLTETNSNVKPGVRSHPSLMGQEDFEDAEPRNLVLENAENTRILRVDSVFLQVDRTMHVEGTQEGYGLLSGVMDRETKQENSFVGSVVPGSLHVYHDKLVWISTSNALSSSSHTNDLLRRLSQVSVVSEAECEESEMRGQKDNSVRIEIQFEDVLLYTLGNIQEEGDGCPDAIPAADKHYLACYTNQMYRMYPIYEIASLQAALEEGMRTVARTSHSFTYEIQRKKLEAERAMVLTELTERGNVWISHYEVLSTVIKGQTSSHRPQDMCEMELLYHSCRLNRQVLQEALKLLQLRFAEEQKEKVRLKCLAIADRIMDRVMMRTHGSVFENFLEWMVSLESSLDPYRWVKLLRVVTRLRISGSEIQKATLATVDEENCAEEFDNWPAFLFFRRLFS